MDFGLSIQWFCIGVFHMWNRPKKSEEEKNWRNSDVVFQQTFQICRIKYGRVGVYVINSIDSF